MNKHREWQEIRADWVNGNRQDARDALINGPSKYRMIQIILSAINAHAESLPDGVTRSGDLVDLYEILKSYGEINY